MAFAPDIALRKLEFDLVIERVAALTVTEPGHIRARRIIPFVDRDEIILELRRVTEFKELLIGEGSIPLEPIRDVLPALKKTTVENQTLSAAELLEIGSLLRVARSLKAFFAKRTLIVPTISSLITRLSGEKVVEYNISQALDEHGGVKDSASRELREIRHGMISAGEALRRRLASILRSVSEQELTQEAIITTRDGRLVIPIKTEHKNRVPGFIHSTSASGATVYIEPAESLELNNTLRELQIREHREIHRILRDLTSQVAEIRPLCEESFLAVVEIDVLTAKARYSIEVIGIAPTIAHAPGFRIVQARHPVLLRHMKREEIIPLTVELRDADRTLLISGPNAGGKTVALKTVGLFCAMANAGLHVPADSDTDIYPFPRMFVDIGDDQSLENDLSTFSSHLMMLKHVLDEADKESLILLDEVGTGTDPTEGGALAAAVLNTLTDRGAITVATTHHGALKVFAHETPGVINGSMEFDTSTLRPSYRFHSGVPGSSYAFELAERIGLSGKTLEDARDRVGEEKSRMESLLLDLETKVRTYEVRLRDTEDERQHLQSVVKSFEQKTAQLRLELGTIRKKAIQEAKEIVRDAQKTIEASVQSIRESGGDRDIIRSSRGAVKKLQDHLVSSGVNDDEEPVVDEGLDRKSVV
jgi:DNA mismatch repair protein MutS2